MSKMDSQSGKRHREEDPEVSPNADHRKRTKRKKPKSVLNHQEAQAQPSELKADHPQPLAPKPEPTTPEDPEMKKKKKEKKRMLKFEGAESNKPNAEDSQLCPKLDSTPKDTNSEPLLSKPESIPPIYPGQKKKKKKKNVLKHEGAELNDLELCPNVDSLPPKDSDPVLLPGPEPAHTEEPFQLKRKRRRKKKKSVLNGEGTESKKPTEELHLCAKLDQLPTKGLDPAPLLEPEPAPLNETDEQKIESEGTESKKPNEELHLCAKLDQLAPKDSDPALLLESEPAPLNESDQQKKKKKRKKKKKNVLNSEVAESNGPIAVLNAQLASECEPLAPEPKKKRLEKGSGLYEICLKCRRPYPCNLCNSSECFDENLEICFFCGKIGHTLGKCPVSPGAKFANCLLCNGRGHLIKSCTQTSHGIKPKVVPADESIKTFISCGI